jgi:aminopeptidase C
LETKVSELETKLQESSVAAEATKTALETATAELETLRAFKADIDAKEVEAARVAKRAARLAELTADAQKVIKTRDETVQETLWVRWEAMEQAEWEVIRDSLNVAKVETKGRYVAASLLEGPLAPGGDSKTTKFEIDQFAK